MNPILILLLFLPTRAYPHQGHDYSKGATKKTSLSETEVLKSIYIKVEPIFQKSCFDCHSHSTQYPFYYNWPGVKAFIQNDIKEALEHLDLSDGFPFRGRATLEEDFTTIAKEVKEREMPPWRYVVFHPSTWISKQDIEKILEFCKQGKEILQKEKYTPSLQPSH